MIAVAVVVAFIAIAVPACRMVGCSMGGAMAWGDMETAGFFGTCGGRYVSNALPVAVVPPGAAALVLSLFAAFFSAVVLFRSPAVVEIISVHASDPPPEPLDARGERLRL